jgi:hypothetical protein
MYVCTTTNFFCTHIHFNEIIFAQNIHFQSVFFQPTSMNLFFWNQKIVTYYELIKQKLLQTNRKVISSKYDSCKFPAFRNASKVQHASLGAGSWCRLLEEVKECAAQKGNSLTALITALCCNCMLVKTDISHAQVIWLKLWRNRNTFKVPGNCRHSTSTKHGCTNH